MRLEDALGLRINGKDALEARLGGQVVWSGSAWTPAALFADGQQGVWYEPKPEHLFQDSAGTVPVTADGDPVGYMQDLSGNGNPALQSTSAARPIYRTDGVLHWLQFDGVDDALVTQPVIQIPSRASGMLVAFAAQGGDGNRGVVNQYGTPETRYFNMTISSTSSAGYDYGVSSGTAASSDDQRIKVSTPVSNHVAIARWAGENQPLQLRLDGADYAASKGSPGPSPTLPSEAIEIGRYAGDFYYKARLYSVIMRNHHLSDIQEIEQYLSNIGGV